MSRKQSKHSKAPIIVATLVAGTVGTLAGHEIAKNSANTDRVPPLKNVPSQADLGEATATEQAEYFDAKRLEQTTKKVSQLTSESVAKAKDVSDIASNIQDVLFGLHAKTGAEMTEIAETYLQDGVAEALNDRNVYFLAREDDGPNCFNMFGRRGENNVENIYVPYLISGNPDQIIGEVVADPQEQQRKVVGKNVVNIS